MSTSQEKQLRAIFSLNQTNIDNLRFEITKLLNLVANIHARELEIMETIQSQERQLHTVEETKRHLVFLEIASQKRQRLQQEKQKVQHIIDKFKVALTDYMIYAEKIQALLDDIAKEKALITTRNEYNGD